ncbi:hypothetical protein CIHG_07618 [Coccidioides immitis H538.4]|uniref:Uncharacterized protein n=2 Tax=Coccidioides immitis TaxID=5501 RepID=A0A0J8RXP7_COCIT|nr:hypothetical protein CIRG_07907 [Coccidioides immitis RMSCC 2394]KMU89935.1 hypothetical protein CIHG_07618 [Coccidioides immitis H538.4]
MDWRQMTTAALNITPPGGSREVCRTRSEKYSSAYRGIVTVERRNHPFDAIVRLEKKETQNQYITWIFAPFIPLHPRPNLSPLTRRSCKCSGERASVIESGWG